MRLSTWILFGLSLALLAAVGSFVASNARREPRALLEDALRRSNDRGADLREALSDLDFALRAAEGEDDPKLAGEILFQRGRLLRRVGSHERARRDLLAVLERYRPGDTAVELELVALELEAGQVERALERIERLVAAHPQASEIRAWHGKILLAQADRLVGTCEEISAALLAAEPLARARLLLRRAAGMQPDLPARVQILHELRGLFRQRDEGEFRRLGRALDQASAMVSRGRDALSRSFEGSAPRSAVDAYLELLWRSGREREAVDFGRAALHLPAARSYPPFLLTLTRSLLALEQPDAAADLLETHLGAAAQPNRELAEAWCQALHDAGRWRELVRTANRLHATRAPGAPILATFHTGIALSRLGEHERAEGPLQQFVRAAPTRPLATAAAARSRSPRAVRKERPDPVPAGMIARAWLELASVYRALERPSHEASVLRRGLPLASEDLQAESGGWLRLAELFARGEARDPRELETALTHALRLHPERSSELLPRWEQAAERWIASSHVPLEEIYDELTERGLHLRPGEAGPYELLALARMHLERGSPAGAVAACRALLADFPGFLPALEVYTQAAQAMGDPAQVARLLLERIERAGADRKWTAELEALPPGALDARERLRLFELDPENSARMAIARWLHEQGRAREALVSLVSAPPALLGDQERLLLARLMLDAGRLGLAQETLEPVGPDSPLAGEALALSIEVALERGDAEHQDRLLRRLREDSATPAAEILDLARRLALEAPPDRPLWMLRALEERPREPDGGVLFALGAAELVGGERTRAREAFQRAQAFAGGGGPEIGLLWLDADERRWSSLPWRVAEVRAAGFEPTPLQEVVLDVLGERLDEAEEGLAAMGEGRDPALLVARAAVALLRGRTLDESVVPGTSRAALDELQLYLRGTGREPRDPRPALARILALEHPDWTPWATAELRRPALTAPGSLWPRALACRGRLALGGEERAAAILRTLLVAWPGFGPGWDLYEGARLRNLGDPDDPELLRLRKRRREELGEREAGAIDALTALAQAAESAGRLQAAVDASRRVLRMDPGRPSALDRLARVHARRGEWPAALAAIEDALAAATSGEEEPAPGRVAAWVSLVEGALWTLDPAQAAAPALATLERLEARFPRDPLVALGLAKAELAAGRKEPDHGLTRSLHRLDRFRERTAGEPLDALRPGSSRPWFDFLAAYASRRAQAFVLADLERTPGSLDLWQMRAEAEATLGDTAEAVRIHELVLRMLPTGRTARSLASLLAERGDVERVEQLASAAVRLEQLSGPDPPLRLTLARAHVQAGGEDLDRGLDLLARLWEGRKSLAGKLDLADLGQTYGTALCWRASAADRELAPKVFAEVGPLLNDPSSANLAGALARLVRSLPPPVP